MGKKEAKEEATCPKAHSSIKLELGFKKKRQAFCRSLAQLYGFFAIWGNKVPVK
jgi:hypothetical protein